MIGLLAAAFPLAFYLAYPSAYWNFDGVACAAALELGNPVYFFHAQHLLYGFLGFLFWKLFLPLGLTKALPALQIFTSILSGGALYFLWRSLRELSKDAWLAFLLTGAAAFSAVFWTWSIEAQVYALGVLGLSAAAYYLLASASPQRMRLLGFWHGIAVLGHLIHGLWMIPALFWIYKERLALRPYFVTFITTVIAAYGAVALFVLRPYQAQGPWLNHWLKGSLGLTADRSMGWHWPGWTGMMQWGMATPGVLWGTFAPQTQIFPHWIYSLTVLSVFLFVGWTILLLGFAKKSSLLAFSVLWMAVYAAFFSTWEPRTLCYRMTDLLPFSMLLMAASLTFSRRALRLAVAGAWMISLGLINFFTCAKPMHDSLNNKVYQETLTLAKITPERSMYLTAGGLPWIYLLYFTGRSAWDVHALSLTEFGKSWSALNPHPALYASSALLHDPEAEPWLMHHHLKILPGLPWLEVS